MQAYRPFAPHRPAHLLFLARRVVIFLIFFLVVAFLLSDFLAIGSDAAFSDVSFDDLLFAVVFLVLGFFAVDPAGAVFLTLALVDEGVDAESFDRALLVDTALRFVVFFAGADLPADCDDFLDAAAANDAAR